MCEQRKSLKWWVEFVWYNFFMDEYHKKYSDLPDSEIENRIVEKRDELKTIFSSIKFESDNIPIKIAVLGCADKRLIQGHERIFEEVLDREVEITTYDINIEHLSGEQRVVEHDCVKPFPEKYDITYAHVLLKFIDKEKQWDLLKNSYDAIIDDGFAIHVLDKDDYELNRVPIDKWIKKLEEIKIRYKLLPIKYGKALVLLK